MIYGMQWFSFVVLALLVLFVAAFIFGGSDDH